MKKYITISRQVAISFVFSILVFVSGVFRTTVLTRNLTIDEFGAFSIFFISVSFFSVILDLGVSHFITTKLAGVSQRVRIRKFFSILCVGVVYVGCLFLLFQISGIKTLFLSELGLESYGVEFTVVWLIVCVAILFRLYHTYVYSMHKIGFSSFVGFSRVQTTSGISIYAGSQAVWVGLSYDRTSAGFKDNDHVADHSSVAGWGFD